jgi:hypothetical protein
MVRPYANGRAAGEEDRRYGYDGPGAAVIRERD